MMNEGVSLRSAPHPRPSLWKRVWFYLWRPTLHESAIVTVEPEGMHIVAGGLKITSANESPTLVDKLRYIGNMQHGSCFPSWMIDEHNNWGSRLSAICNEAAERIEQLERQLKDQRGYYR